MDKVWRFNVDYTKVSDPYYFNDLDSTHGSSTDGYATQKFSVGYAEQNWNATLSTTQFQVFADAGNTNAYRAEPQLDLNYYKTISGRLTCICMVKPLNLPTKAILSLKPIVITLNRLLTFLGQTAGPV